MAANNSKKLLMNILLNVKRVDEMKMVSPITEALLESATEMLSVHFKVGL